MKTHYAYSFAFAITSVMLFFVQISFAQTNIFPSTGSAGIGTTAPDASSALEIKSTSQGLLISRMTKTQRDAIVSPSTGLMVYQTNNSPGFYYYTGTGWTAVKPKGWLLSGNAGTDVATNFIGTTDAQPLMFKINNSKAGYIDFDAAKANTGFGYQTLFLNATGYFNTANGYQALYSNTSGKWNTASGFKSLFSSTTGYSNTASGCQSLFYTTTGYSNTAHGYQPLFYNTAGYSNTANGYRALFYNSTGNFNTAHGHQSLYANTGSSNTANGYRALYSTTTGSNNTALGYSADVSAGNLSNATALGSEAYADASNKVRIGNTAVTKIGGQVSWSTFSDGRYKKNIKQDVKGLVFINMLKPISYTVDVNSLNEYYNKGRKQDSAYENMKATIQPSTDEASKIVYNGFIAQEVEAAAKKLNYDFSGVDKPATQDGLYALRYADFVVPLVKAVQELSSQNSELKIQNDEQQKINLNLQKQIDELKAIVLTGSQSKVNNQRVTINGKSETAKLEQNIPNPFNHTTTINYNLPQQFSSAKIIITDKSGKVLKEVNLPESGKGSVTVDASMLSSGAYQYSLYLDGKLIAAKQMILSK